MITPKPGPVAKSSVIRINRRFQLALHNFEIWLPSNETNSDSKIASVSLRMNLNYTSSSKFTWNYDSDDVFINTEYLLCDDEANIELRGLALVIGYLQDN